MKTIKTIHGDLAVYPKGQRDNASDDPPNVLVSPLVLGQGLVCWGCQYHHLETMDIQRIGSIEQEEVVTERICELVKTGEIFSLERKLIVCEGMDEWCSGAERCFAIRSVGVTDTFDEAEQVFMEEFKKQNPQFTRWIDD